MLGKDLLVRWVRVIPNSEVARVYVKKPLTRLATLATLSPRERAEIICH
jgi:hypothetical protein